MNETVELVVKFKELNHIELIDKEILNKIKGFVTKPYKSCDKSKLYLPKCNYGFVKSILKKIDHTDADMLISAMNSTGHELIYFITREEM